MVSDTVIDVAPDPYEVDPAWDLDRTWTEQEYLNFGVARGLEFGEGNIEVLPTPSLAHQFMLAMLYDHLSLFVKSRKPGFVLFAGVRVRTLELHYREPDLAFLRAESAEHMSRLYWEHATLVMEVVTDDDRRRDVHTKRREYARA